MATADRCGRRPLLGLVAASLSLILGASNGAASERPQLQPWAQQLQQFFDQLPGVGTAAPPTRVEGCAVRVKMFEALRITLIPAPTPDIEDALRAYIEALLALYQECPDDLDRAKLLHDRANDKGREFENLVNRSLPGTFAGSRGGASASTP